jgi:hypothetical protein
MHQKGVVVAKNVIDLPKSKLINRLKLPMDDGMLDVN